MEFHRLRSAPAAPAQGGRQHGAMLGVQTKAIILRDQLFPSGKQPHNYKKSPFLMGKLTMNGPFSIAMLNYQRVNILGSHKLYI